MARAKELEATITEIRNLLRSNHESDTEKGLQNWAEAADDFEVFLDILDGIITTLSGEKS